MALTDIVNVTISRETTVVSRQGFGTLMFLGKSKAFTEKVKIYSSTTEMATDGFLATDPEYIAAQKYFSQENHPANIYIGRQHGDDVVINVDTVENSADYSVVINGTTITFTSDVDATSNEITLGLAAAIDGEAEVNTIVDATDNGDGTVTVSPLVGGTDYTLTIPSAVSSRLSASVTTTDTLVQAIAAIQAEDDDWYAIATHSHVKADIEAVAADIETKKKLFLASSQDADVITGATTDVATALKTAAYTRTAVMYHDEADTSFPEAAWAGRCLGRDPGSITWKFKTLAGINPVTLSTTQENNAHGKNANTYTTVGGVNITAEGKVASGEFIDVIRGLDWLESRITEGVFSALANSEKVPYTDGGITVIKDVVSSWMQEAVDKDVLAGNPEPVVTAPRARDVSAGDKTSRTLNNVTFTATLAGAIHFVNINGTVTV